VVLLERMLHGAGYTMVRSTTRTSDVCALQAEHRYDLILLDLKMPEMDGFQVMEWLQAIEVDGYLPVLVITARPEHKLRALGAGDKDFISKQFVRMEVLALVYNILEVRPLHQALRDFNATLEQLVRELTADLHNGYVETIITMPRAAEHKDVDTGAHVRRISHYCSKLARAPDMDAEFADRIFFASPMHDIGNIGIPDHILLKPGSFTVEEWAVMKTQTLMGSEILG
jgi:putative two-component system response regulator